MYRDRQQKRSFKEFGKELKEEKLNNCILMYGAEQYLVKWAVDSLVKRYVNPAAGVMDYVVIDEDVVRTSQMIEACETFSMFSEKRIIWVKNYKPLMSKTPKGYTEKEINQLIEYGNNINQSSILVISGEEINEKNTFCKELMKVASTFEFSQLEKRDLISFANKRFKTEEVAISDREMNFLIDATGYYNKESDYRLYNFENDILKVIAHSDGKEITEKDIAETVNGDTETFVFDLLDGISGNQKDKAFKLLNNKIHEGEDIRPIVSLIISQFENMLSVKEMRENGLNPGEIQKKLKLSEYRLKKMIPYVNRYSLEKFKEILSSAYEITWNTNSGLMSSQMAMEMFIAKI